MLIRPRGELKQLSDKLDLTWTDFENIPSHLLINIAKGPDYSVTREAEHFEKHWK